MRPGPPAVCVGTIMHHRIIPVDHRFTYPVTMIWIDPDRPDDLTRHHRLWSARHPAPIRFRRSDYLDGTSAPLGPTVRHQLATVLGQAPTGPIRMLTQPRTWGWLFNPITIYLAWADDATPNGVGTGATDTSATAAPDTPDARPVAALLEVTNTPWKERHLYPVALPAGPVDFDKVLHVSPFLGQDYRYRLDISTSQADASGRADVRFPRPPLRRLTIALDVVKDLDNRCIQGADGTELAPQKTPDAQVVLTTRLVVDQYPVERAMLSQAIRHNPMPTHRVSLGIHRQALRLWRRGVPFVAHPHAGQAPRPTGDGAIGGGVPSTPTPDSSLSEP